MTDNYEFINCPACGTKMKKVFLQEQQFIADVCLDGCGGIWLDSKEISKIDEKHENIQELINAKLDKEYNKVEDTKRICPICNVKMVKNYINAKKEITVDECYTCGGKFFDHGEIELLRNQYENDEARLNDIMNLLKNNDYEKILEKYGCEDESISNKNLEQAQHFIDNYYKAKYWFTNLFK